MFARTRSARSGLQPQVGAAERDDPRVGVGAGRRPRAGPPTARRRARAWPASVRPPECSMRRRARPVGAHDRDLTSHPVTIVPPAALEVVGHRRATAAKSTTPVAGEWSAAIPAAWGSISRSSLGSIRRRPGTPLARPRRSSSSRRGSSDGSVATITLPSAPGVDPALLAVLVQAPGALRRTGAPSASPGRSRCRRGSRRSSGRSDGSASCGLPLEHDDARVGMAPPQLARGRRSRRCPPPTTQMSPLDGVPVVHAAQGKARGRAPLLESSCVGEQRRRTVRSRGASIALAVLGASPPSSAGSCSTPSSEIFNPDNLAERSKTALVGRAGPPRRSRSRSSTGSSTAAPVSSSTHDRSSSRSSPPPSAPRLPRRPSPRRSGASTRSSRTGRRTLSSST